MTTNQHMHVSSLSFDSNRDLLRQRYASVLERTKTYLSQKQTTKTGGSISTIRRQTLEEKEADCPQCGQKFRGKNNNTEHIHAKALGGAHSEDHNRIQLCNTCNNARNITMQGFIGMPPFRKHLECNWEKIEAYLLWSEVTVDDGLEAGAQIPEVHELFIEARFAGEMPTSAKPNRAFGRFSTWTIGSEPNYPHNVPATLKVDASIPVNSQQLDDMGEVHEETHTSPTLRFMLARMTRNMLDWIFDFDSESIHGSVKRPSKSGLASPETSIKPFNPEQTLTKWREILDKKFEENMGMVPLGTFWEMVAQEKDAHHMAWRAFERELSICHKGNMPSKAAELLEQMEYSFCYVRTDEGYLISLNHEEE